MKQYYILYNPNAGNGSGRQAAEKLKTVLAEDELHFVDITRLNGYESFFAELPEGAVPVLCGGDGTINRFVNDTKDFPLPEGIHYFPAGTGNDFLRDLEIQPEKPICIDPYLRRLPEVTVKGKTYRFLNNVGFGIDGYCCEVGDKLREKSDKPVNYAGIAIKGLLFHFKPVTATVTVDGNTYIYKKAWLAPTMNGRFYGGGMMATPDQNRLAEPKTVSVMLMHGSGRLHTLIVFPSIFKGEHIKNKMVAVHSGKEITVKFDRPTALQIDGETILDVTEYSVRAEVKETVKA